MSSEIDVTVVPLVPQKPALDEDQYLADISQRLRRLRALTEQQEQNQRTNRRLIDRFKKPTPQLTRVGTLL